jgi:peptidoglycan/xylan/chitin deacetylase (PgdA/CDA1 family)
MRVAPAVVAFGGPAIAVVLISTAVTLRGGAAAVRPQPARFSGSTVVQRLPSLLASPRLPSPISVAVVRDDAAASFYDTPAALDSIVARWRDALVATGAAVRVLSPSAARDDRSARVLVVPSSPCLTIETREALDAAGARGTGVILSGITGTYDGGCRPIGYGLIVGATGAARADVLEPREMAYVTFPSASPLAADIPPGARLDLNPGRQVALRHPTRDAFYSDYSLQPEPAHGEPLLDAALTHASIDGRRVVYWGFELSDVVNRPWDRAIARLLVRNSVAWAASQPLATIEPWPNGKRAAASIAQDVESGFANARHAVDSLRAAGVRSTFYLTSGLAQRYERLSRRLAQSDEIGTHGDTHRLLGGLSSGEQRARLAATQHDLLEIVGSRAHGLRPPEEQFDTATMSAWLASAGNYLFGANDSRAAAPELLRIGRDTLVLVGRVGSDDFAATARHAPTVDALSAIFLADYERVRALGGHYVLSYHSQVLARPELVASLASVARRLAADTAVWVAPVGDVADWWRARARLDVRARIAGGAMRVVVHNAGDRLVRGAVVSVVLPDAKRVARSDARLLPSHAPTIRLLVPPLPPRTTKAFTVTLGSEILSGVL